jgi:aminodeoxyfutalosine synthase
MSLAPLTRRSIESAGLGDILAAVEAGARLDAAAGERLFTHPDVPLLGAMAALVGQHRHGRRVYFNRNLHINATNVCEAGCVFCSFARLKTGDPAAWTLSTRQAVERLRKAGPELLSEVHTVNGLNPDLPFAYYTDLLRALKAERPELHIKGFTAVEVHYFAEKYGMSVSAVLEALRAAGLGSLPGGGAEIFAPRARKKLCDDKVDADGWLFVHAEAHRLGMRSNATMLFGSLETVDERVDHLLRLRALQDESLAGPARDPSHGGGHFQTFIPLRFHNENNRLARLAGPTGLETLRVMAVSRLMLDNFPHVKAYWPMMGVAEAQLALAFGASDLDGTVREEHIYHMAGAATPQELSRGDLIRLIENAGGAPVERDTLYDVLRRCDPPSRAAVLPAGVRIGWVAYENARPLVHGLDAAALRGGHPADVARWLAAGEVDVALLPVGALLSADLPADLRVVPDVCIGAEGRVDSVLLLADSPPEAWEEVRLDGRSRTSALLARLLLTVGPLGRRLPPGARIVDVPAGEGLRGAGGRVAGLVIGDDARAALGRHAVAVDLAAAWTDWTGLPFVFAVWAGRPGLAPAAVEALRATGLAGLAALADGSLLHGADADTVTYLTARIRYPLDDRATMGLLRFAALARAAGLVARDTVSLYAPEAPAAPGGPVEALLDAAPARVVPAPATLDALWSEARLPVLLTAAAARRRALFAPGTATYGLDTGAPVDATAGGAASLVVDPADPAPALAVLGQPGPPLRVVVRAGPAGGPPPGPWLGPVLAAPAGRVRSIAVGTAEGGGPLGATGVDWLRLLALVRLGAADGVHVEADWARFGRGFGQLALLCGADDFGLVPAGPDGEMVDGEVPMGVAEAERCLRLAGFTPVPRGPDFAPLGEARTAAEALGRPLRRLDAARPPGLR